jgi:formylglycine-generating enzyme required for sulfatase activity
MDRAWQSVEGYAQTSAIPSEDRLSAVNRFLQDFPENNPHQAEAQNLIAHIRQESTADPAQQIEPDQIQEKPTTNSAPVLEANIPTGKPPIPDEVQQSSEEDSQAMVRIQGGTFWMGSAPDETCEWDSIFKVEFCLPERNADYAPRHQVTVKDFWLDSHEVTNQEFERFVQSTAYTGSKEPSGSRSALIETSSLFFGKKWEVEKIDHADWKQPDGHPMADSRIAESLPVVQVSWYDAQAYCQWQEKRLPTEAEWEYAARAGSTTRHWWGENIPEQLRVANLPDASLKTRFDLEPVFPDYHDGSSRLSSVGSYQPNGWGLYDMAGNAWEWTADWYDMAYYQHSPEINPLGPSTGTQKVRRGGSWLQYTAITSRGKQAPENSDDQTGFRCAKNHE